MALFRCGTKPKQVYKTENAITADNNQIITVNLPFEPDFVMLWDGTGTPSTAGRVGFWDADMGTSLQGCATDGFHTASFNDTLQAQSAINRVSGNVVTYSTGRFAVQKQIFWAAKFE